MTSRWLIILALSLFLHAASASGADANSCLQIRTGTRVPSVSPNLQRLTDLRRLPFEGECIKEAIQVGGVGSGCDSDDRSNPMQGLEWIQESVERELCQREFDPAEWDRLIPAVAPSQLSRDQAKIYLRKFQKPGGFEPARDLPALVGILRSDLPAKEPDLALGALQGVLHVSDLAYEDLLREFPVLSGLKQKSGLQCITKKEEENLIDRVEGYLKRLEAELGSRTPMDRWEGVVAPLRPILTRLPPDRKDYWIDRIAQNLADSAHDQPAYKEVFLSKLLKFTLQSVSPWFGVEPKSITDLTLTRSSRGVTPVLLGTAPLGEPKGSLTSYGFHSRSLEPIRIPANAAPGQVLAESPIDWEHDGRRYQSQLNVRVSDRGKEDLVSVASAPDYPALWKDGKLTGMIMTGSNMAGDSIPVMDQYWGYFERQGFVFGEKGKIPDLKAFLQQKISGGELDYFLKEAHSDGDEKNLFRVDLNSRYILGKRRLPDGREERVYLIYPDSGESRTELISNSEFGEWIRGREAGGHGQFAYFNTSCWSTTKAVHEIEATRSRLLLNIPSTTAVEYFSEHEWNAQALLLDAFREGKNYGEIRQELDRNPAYRKNTSNRFIFPDQPEYASRVLQPLSTPLVIQQSITDEQGRPYSIEEQH